MSPILAAKMVPLSITGSPSKPAGPANSHQSYKLQSVSRGQGAEGEAHGLSTLIPSLLGCPLPFYIKLEPNIYIGSHLLRDELQLRVRLPQPSGSPISHSQPRDCVPFKRSAVRREEGEKPPEG